MRQLRDATLTPDQQALVNALTQQPAYIQGVIDAALAQEAAQTVAVGQYKIPKAYLIGGAVLLGMYILMRQQ